MIPKGKTRGGLQKVLLLLALAATGCTGSCSGLGTVAGVVRYKGRQLKSGEITWTVVFVSPDGRQAMGVVGADGKYIADQVPTGPVKIAVVGAPRVAAAVPDPGSPPPRYGADGYLLSLLKQYQDPDRSGLTYSVRKGKEGRDIDLNP